MIINEESEVLTHKPWKETIQDWAEWVRVLKGKNKAYVETVVNSTDSMIWTARKANREWDNNKKN